MASLSIAPLRAFAALLIPLLLIGFSVERALAHGAYHDLVNELEAKLAESPGILDYRYQLAIAHVEHGEWEAALHQIERLTRLAPGKFETGLLSGRALAAAGLLADSLEALNAHLAIHSGDQATLVERARVHLKLGRIDAGVDDYLGAIATPARAEIYIEASEALRRLGRGEDALRCAEEGERKSGGDPSVIICVMECARELGQIDAVVDRLDRLRLVWPRPEIWMQQKAEFLHESGREAESKTAWKELYDHLMSLPNLERAAPFLAGALEASRDALGVGAVAPVSAPPAAVSP